MRISILTSLNILKRVGPTAAPLHPTSQSIPPTALTIETKKCLTRRNLVNKSPRYVTDDTLLQVVVTGSDVTLIPLFVDVVVVKMSVRSHSLFIPQIGDVCWVEIAATDMSRGQAFYKTVFGWEFASPPSMPEGTYAIFKKPGTKLAGGMYPAKEGDMIQPKVNSEGKGQATNRIIMRVEEVDDALKKIVAAGGAIISYVLCVMTCGQFD